MLFRSCPRRRRAQVLNLMKDLQDEFQLAFLFISHDLSLVRALADHVAVMRDGAIIEQGVTKEIFESPADEYTEKLLAAVPVVRAQAEPASNSRPRQLRNFAERTL